MDLDYDLDVVTEWRPPTYLPIYDEPGAPIEDCGVPVAWRLRSDPNPFPRIRLWSRRRA